MLNLHDRGILTPEYYEEIKEFWERVSDIPLEILRQIAYGEYNIFSDPLLLKSEASSTMRTFLQAYEAVISGQLDIQAIPWKELLNVIRQQVLTDKRNSAAFNGTIEKVLHNISRLAEEKAGNKEQILEILQIAIGMLLLAEHTVVTGE